MSFNFNASNLQANLESFLYHGTERIRQLDAFNADVRTMQKLFKSHGLSGFAVTVNSSLDQLIWDEERSLILCCHALNPDAPQIHLLETDFLTRDRVRRESWLNQMLEEGIEELRRMKEDEEKFEHERHAAGEMVV